MADNIPAGMADDKREETRARLLAAAADVFAKKGYERASVDDIAQAAGFTKGAVYWNFASKEELFLALVQEREAALLDEFFAAAAARSDDYVANLTEVFKRRAPDPNEWKIWMEFRLYASRRPALARKMKKQGDEAFQALVAALDQRISQTPGRQPPLSTAVLARLYVAIFDGINQQRAIDPASVDDDLFPTLLRFIEDAYAALSRDT
jgi:AcrR family transcriptional regulator